MFRFLCKIHLFRLFLCSWRYAMNRTRNARPYAAMDETVRQIGIREYKIDRSVSNDRIFETDPLFIHPSVAGLY